VAIRCGRSQYAGHADRAHRDAPVAPTRSTGNRRTGNRCSDNRCTVRPAHPSAGADAAPRCCRAFHTHSCQGRSLRWNRRADGTEGCGRFHGPTGGPRAHRRPRSRRRDHRPRGGPLVEETAATQRRPTVACSQCGHHHAPTASLVSSLVSSVVSWRLSDAQLAHAQLQPTPLRMLACPLASRGDGTGGDKALGAAVCEAPTASTAPAASTASTASTGRCQAAAACKASTSAAAARRASGRAPHCVCIALSRRAGGVRSQGNGSARGDAAWWEEWEQHHDANLARHDHEGRCAPRAGRLEEGDEHKSLDASSRPLCALTALGTALCPLSEVHVRGV